MKKFLLILLFINSFCVGQDVKIIENKVCELYKTYSKKRGINAIAARANAANIVFISCPYSIINKNYFRLSIYRLTKG